ncbi:MAG: hypothetical protein IKS28_04450 [Clostridia bacterium]|nr:hypothetical protein [Clostridia bacterium]
MKKIDDDCGNTAESVREPFVPELSTEDYAFGKPAADIVKLALPAIFDSGMMFQRDKPIRVFGVAPNGAEVELDWDGNIYKSFSDGVSGRFLAEIPPESAGKGHTLAVRCGEQSLTYTGIMVGDVFLCGGQSNMELHMDDSEWYGDFYTSQFDTMTVSEDIKQFFIPVSAAAEISYDFPAGSKWQTATRENLGDFAPLPYLFAVRAWKDSGVPTAVIMCSAGGTAVQQWMSIEAQDGIKGSEKSQFYPLRAHQYNSMVSPLFPFSFGACFFYQGEANGSYDVLDGLYQTYLKTMISEWRSKDFDSGLPFYIIELAGFLDERFAVLRADQRQVCADTENCYIVPNYDLGDIQNIHPTTKDVLSERMMKIYSATACGRNVDWQSPEMESTEIRDGAVVVKFVNCGKGLTAKKKNSVQGFEVAGADGKFYAASGKITGADTIEVRSSRVPEPVYVRYFITGYINSDSPVNSAGLPITPFSTSDVPLVFNGYLIQR